MAKLLIAVVHSEDAPLLVEALRSSDLRVTEVLSRGGFLQARNAMLFIGVEDAQVPAAMKLIEDNCRSRVQEVLPEPLGGCIGWLGCGPTGGSSGGRREVGQAKADHDHPSEKQGDEQTLRVAAKAKSKERDYSKKKRPDDTGGKRQRRN